VLLPELLDARRAASDRQHLWRFPAHKVELPLGDIVSSGTTYASALRSLGVGAGDRVGLVLENGPEYPSILLGIWACGAIAVPLRSSGGLRFDMAGFLRDIDSECRFTVLIVEDDASEAAVADWIGAPGRRGVRQCALRGLADGAERVKPSPLHGSDLAVLQYSSGSTARPKGVMVTHAMIRDQLVQIDAEYRYGCGGQSIRSSGSWLPFHHDMGLFIGILYPLFASADNVLASPLYYMRDPKRWFRMQAEHRVDWNFTTNLAMANSVASLLRLDPAAVDLSRLYVYLAAEKVSPVVLERTCAALGRLGTPRDHVRVGYGMAENALAVASTKDGAVRSVRVRAVNETALTFADASDPESTEVVSIGKAHVNTSVTIRDDAGRTLPDMTVGEICVEGPCVTPGYYNDSAKTAQHLAGGRLRTRDLGFCLDGELYFLARKDDILNVGGRNIAPDDVEDCVESMERIPAGGAVLIDVPAPATGKTELVLLVELPGKLSPGEAAECKTMLQRHVLTERGLLINRVAFARKNALEKTSSGKKRRKIIRERFVRQELELS
jgi:acyl-CoA synthetase (AMP-forming)/AMP-acid ligase II